MKIKEINISKGRKIGLPNYSSVDVHASITMDVEADNLFVTGKTQEAFETIGKELQKVVDNMLRPYGVSDEINEARSAREAEDPTQNWDRHRGKIPDWKKPDGT